MLYKENSKLSPILIWSIWIFIFVFCTISFNFYIKKNYQIFVVFLIITVLLFFIFINLFFTKLVLSFHETYISYSYFPLIRKEKKIYYSEIKNIKIINIDPISDFGGWGNKKSKKYGQGYITNSYRILFIEKKNDVRISFSVFDIYKINDIIVKFVK